MWDVEIFTFIIKEKAWNKSGAKKGEVKKKGVKDLNNNNMLWKFLKGGEN